MNTKKEKKKEFIFQHSVTYFENVLKNKHSHLLKNCETISNVDIINFSMMFNVYVIIMLGKSAEFFNYSQTHATPQNGGIHFTATPLS